MTRLAAALLGAALLGCSTVPDPVWPPTLAGELVAVYRFKDGAPRIFRVPASDDELTVLFLEADPPVVTERFVDGQRIWIAPPDLEELRVRCGYRLWGHVGATDPFGTAPQVSERFPGADIVQHQTVRD